MATLRSFAPCRGFVDLAVSPRLTPWTIFFRSTSLNSDRSRIPTLMSRTPPAVVFDPGRVRSRPGANADDRHVPWDLDPKVFQ